MAGTTDIAEALASLGQAFPETAAGRFAALLDELERWNRKVNLTAIRDRAEMVRAHLVDSLAVRFYLRGTDILDIGTGAGFPGLPLAIAEPERRFTLLDSNSKKVAFVEHVSGLLGLDNVSVSRSRAEDFAPGKRFDTVVARAVGALPKLLAIAGHHVGEDGGFVALKGRYPAAELEQVPDTWDTSVQELKVPGLEAGSRHVVLMEHR